MLADFCLWVFEFETFCDVFIHHFAALVQKELQKSGGKKFFWNTLLLNLKKNQSIFREFDNIEKTEERGCLEIVILEVKVRHCEPSSLIDGK